MLELQGYQDGTKGTEHTMQYAPRAKTSAQARNGRDRSDSRTALDIPGNRFARLNIQYTRPTIDTSRRITKVSVMSPFFCLFLRQVALRGVGPELIPACSRLSLQFPAPLKQAASLHATRPLAIFVLRVVIVDLFLRPLVNALLGVLLERVERYLLHARPQHRMHRLRQRRPYHHATRFTQQYTRYIDVPTLGLRQ